jgi:transcriptional regulator with XRE-family HTH domain
MLTPFGGNVNLVSTTEGYALKLAQFDWIDQMASGDIAFFTALGKRMAQLRIERDLTQQQVADALGIAQQTLGNYETGRSRLPISLLPALTALFGVPLDVLLGQTEHSSRTKKPGPMPKWQQQIETIARLPKPKQRLVTQMIDALLQQAAR